VQGRQQQQKTPPNIIGEEKENGEQEPYVTSKQEVKEEGKGRYELGSLESRARA